MLCWQTSDLFFSFLIQSEESKEKEKNKQTKKPHSQPQTRGLRNRSVPDQGVGGGADFRADVGGRYIEKTVNEEGNGSVAREQRKPRQADLYRRKRKMRKRRKRQ